MSQLTTHARYPYSGISQRPDYSWPEGRRLAVYIGVNLEHFSFGQGLGAKLAPSAEPDVLNYAWRDYGNRVGAWRLLELFDALRLPVAVLANTAIYDYCPELMAAHRARAAQPRRVPPVRVAVRVPGRLPAPRGDRRPAAVRARRAEPRARPAARARGVGPRPTADVRKRRTEPQ